MSPFDRCDEDTIAVFNTAVAEARRLGHSYVGTEHLLVALVDIATSCPTRSLRSSPVTWAP